MVLAGVAYDKSAINYSSGYESRGRGVHTVRAVYHHDLRQVLLPQRLAHGLDAVLVEVGTLRPTTQNNEAVLVTACPGNGSKTLLRHTHEMMFRGRAADRVNRHCEAAVGAVLETNGERETRGKLTVQLRLGGTRTNSAEGDQIRKELGGDGVEHLRGNRHASRCEVNEELAGDAQTLVDLEGLIDIWVVDQALPANCCAGLFEVGSHDDANVVLELVGEGLQALAVLERKLRVVQ